MYNAQTLAAVLEDEDSIAFMGYAPVDQQMALLGAITKLPAADQAKALIKILKPKNVNDTKLSDRGQAIARLGGLHPDIQKGLAGKRLQLADTRFYAVKVPGAALTLRMLESADTKAPGVTNINNGKLEKDNWFLLTGIRLLSGVEADPKNASYSTIEKAITNGDFEFKAGGNKYLLPKDTSCQDFDTSNRTDIEDGLFRISNPKWIEPMVDIEFNLRFSQACAANTNIKVVFHGVSVINF